MIKLREVLSSRAKFLRITGISTTDERTADLLDMAAQALGEIEAVMLYAEGFNKTLHMCDQCDQVKPNGHAPDCPKLA